MPRTAGKNISGQLNQMARAPIKHITPKNKAISKISSKSSSSQRKIVPVSKEEEDKSIRPTTVRSLERKEAKKNRKKRIGKIHKLDRKTKGFAKS